MPDRLTPEAREQIRQRAEAARAAAPEPWTLSGGMSSAGTHVESGRRAVAHGCDQYYQSVHAAVFGPYIASVDPTTILSLLAELDAEKHERAIAEAARDANGAQAQKFLEIVERLGAELDALQRERDGRATEEFACAVAGQRTADPPQECDFPFCGCSRVATETMESLLESGWIDREGAAELRQEAASLRNETATANLKLLAVQRELAEAIADEETAIRGAVEMRARAEQLQAALTQAEQERDGLRKACKLALSFIENMRVPQSLDQAGTQIWQGNNVLRQLGAALQSAASEPNQAGADQ